MIPRELHERNLRALLEPIAPLLAQADVSEIMINGPSRIYVERGGRVHATTHRFDSDAALMSALRAVAQFAGRDLGGDDPVLEARLPDGSRIEAVLPPAAPEGPVVSIRRFGKSTLSLEELVARGSLRAQGAVLLRALVTERRNILVAGGTGSGKTSLLCALTRFIGRDERLIVIEDARELSLPHEHVVHLEACPAAASGQAEISVRKLFKTSLRLRPDRLVVGEIRGPEALELVQAMTSGHRGCMSTIHADSPLDALHRLETLAAMSDVPLPLWALRAQIASAVDVVVQTARGADGKRHVTEVVRVRGQESGYVLESAYEHGEPSRAERGFA